MTIAKTLKAMNSHQLFSFGEIVNKAYEMGKIINDTPIKTTYEFTDKSVVVLHMAFRKVDVL